ncbi:hypothetical protein NPX13_g7737 [Xylaria arbuscula]|uniref:Uncharacterized protein n=1 Tax=Xylaria arbuscula TaxID=114810 RepID=A0A9W8N9S1_9PEZI|nr:hypothetical protein NPX13_g7737 [Xylaria arbuscula]
MSKPPTPHVPYNQPRVASRMPPARPPPRVDTSSTAYKQAYKQAASKYTRLMIAMPILLVTSYYLFDRLALGHEAKTLRGAPTTTEANEK